MGGFLATMVCRWLSEERIINVSRIYPVMFESIKRSWNIVAKSFGVLMSEKRLLVFPALSMLALIALLASFIVPVFIFDNSVLFFPLLFLFYFAAYFVAIFFNVALVHASGEKLEGRQVSLSGSVSFAFSKAVNIIGWALFSATVGLILGMMRSQSNSKGLGGIIIRIAASIIGVAWSFAAFLVVPVMVFENVGPLTALKRSVELLKSTWSEQAWGTFSISGVVFLFYLPAIGLGILLLMMGQGTLLMFLLPMLLLYVALVFVLQGALEGIFTAELYKYAATGKAVVFENELSQGMIDKQAPIDAGTPKTETQF